MDQMWPIRELIYDTYMDIDNGLVSHVLSEVYQIDALGYKLTPEYGK